MYKIIGADGKEYGPISAGQMRQWITEGRVNGQTRVLPEGQTDWKLLSEVPELASLLATPDPLAGTPGPIGAAAPIPTIYPVAQPAETNPLAIAGLVLGILSVVLSCCCYGLPFNLAGIIVSAIALNQISKNPHQTGKGLAIAGLALSILSIVLGVVFLIVGVAMSGSDFLRKLQKM